MANYRKRICSPRLQAMYVGCGPELLRGVTFQAILEMTREQVAIPNRRFFGVLEE